MCRGKDMSRGLACQKQEEGHQRRGELQARGWQGIGGKAVGGQAVGGLTHSAWDPGHLGL